MVGKVKIVKIDTDKYPKVATRYGIQVHSSLLLHAAYVVVADDEYGFFITCTLDAHNTFMDSCIDSCLMAVAATSLPLGLDAELP